MFERDEHKEVSREVETVIGPSVKVEGNFVGEGNIVVEGTVHGMLKTRHNLRVGKDAKIKADVQAANLYVAGEIRGNVKVSEKAELSSTARILGNLETKVLSIETGATLHGKCIMVTEPGEQAAKKQVKQ